MGDDGKTMDTQLLMHIMGMAKKGGMREPIVDELLGIIREQAEIDEQTSKQQLPDISPNPPFDMQFIRNQFGLNQPQGSKADLFTKMLEDSFRAGWKADDEWDCFIEVTALGELSTDEIDEAVKLIQEQADTQEVPVRLYANGYRCIAYPGGKWVDALTQWHEAKLAARKQAKSASFSMAPTMITMNYAKADADATLKLHVLKSRKPVEGKPADHFFSALDLLVGDED